MHFINTSDLMGPDWRFLEPYGRPGDGLSWEFHYGRPANALERALPRPAVGRYRAALAAVRSARRQRGRAVLVSHLPNMAAAVNVLRMRLCPDVPHIAFAFNFTDPPEGRRRAILARALAGIDEYTVFSSYERPFYADLLGLPEARIAMLPWAMDPPEPGPENPLGPDPAPYLCSVGGEGRDYALLAEAMRRRPDLRMAVVARPRSVVGVDFPENVTLFTDLPGPLTWRLAVDSLGMALPLKTDRTACGHVTLVGAQLLGLPLAITGSEGVRDYVDAETALIVPAGDAAALAEAVGGLAGNRAAALRRAEAARATAAERSNPLAWLAYFEALAARFGGRG